MKTFEETITKWMEKTNRFIFVIDDIQTRYVIPIENVSKINVKGDDVLGIDDYFIAYDIQEAGLYKDVNLGGISIIITCLSIIRKKLKNGRK